jgi:pimeloyl-ACP methyl ester carboxylesterase
MAGEPPLEGKFAPANGLDIYYQEWGDGRPLILLHGATDTHEFWDPFIPFFSEKYRVIAPDNRGHGRTINPDPKLTYPMMADDLAGLIQVLDLADPLIFGYSDGGQAALDFVIRYPGLAAALVIGGVWFQFSRSYQDAITKAGFISPGVVDYEVFERQVPENWEEKLGEAHHDPRPGYPRILLSNLAQLWWTPLNYSGEDFRKVVVPALIIMGEKDEMISWEEGRELARQIPEAEFALIPDAGHTEVIVDQGAFLKLVLDFLDRWAS